MVAKRLRKRKNVIHSIETVPAELTSRAGLTLFVEYMERIGVVQSLANTFADIKGNRKGFALPSLFLQVLTNFIDGTTRSLIQFDNLQNTPSYAGLIGLAQHELVSSHAVKRMFGKFGTDDLARFDALYLDLFAWRLRKEKPTLIECSIDSVVYDNDDAVTREGVRPTYKKVKGFQPLSILWNGFTIWSEFRDGSTNGNNGTTVVEMVKRVVERAREAAPQAEIVFKVDAGFFDQDIMTCCTMLGVGCIMTGKMYEGVKKAVKNEEKCRWYTLQKGRVTWQFRSIDYRPTSWDETLKIKAIYTSMLTDETGQGLFDFARPDQVILTNINLVGGAGVQISAYKSLRDVVEAHHQRGKDELIHRAVKEFGSEKLPMKRFTANAAYYHLMVIAHTIFLSFQRDIMAKENKEFSVAMPTTIRRLVIDVGGRIVRTGRRIIMKVAGELNKRSLLERLWIRLQKVTLQPVSP